MVKNRQRKKIGKVGIAIIIISVIILTSGLGFTLWYYTEMIRHKPTESVLGERFGSFGYAPITLGENAYFENFSSRFDTYSTEIKCWYVDRFISRSEEVSCVYTL
jgi:hypothetical protein